MFAAHRDCRKLLLINFNISAKHVETMIQLLEVGDGIAALEMIRSLTPDVIVLGRKMPLLNDPELAHIVRSPVAFPTPDIPIILLTAHGER
jgi:CheY-like chemotaxis protein